MKHTEILRLLDLALGASTPKRVFQIYRAADDGGTIQAWDMVDLFPGRPQLHNTTSMRLAMLADGCVDDA